MPQTPRVGDTDRVRNWTIGLTSLILVTAAACSGGGTSSTPARHSPAADQAAVGMMVIKATDVPDGWDSTPHDPTNTNSSYETQLEDCAHFPTAVSGSNGISAEAYSDNFSTATDNVSSKADITNTLQNADMRMAAVQQAGWIDCVNPALSQELQAGLGKDAQVTNVMTRSLDVTPIRGFVTVATRTNFSVKGPGLRPFGLADFILMQKGRVLLQFTLVGFLGPLDPSLEQHLLSAVAARVTAAEVG